MNELTLSTAEDCATRATNYFRDGYNCAESVLLAFLDTHTAPFPREIVTLSSGFGGGIGRSKNLCGAVSGAVLALSAVKGRNPLAHETRAARSAELSKVYPLFHELVTEIEDHCGSLICRELSAPHGDFESKARRQSCLEMIGYCAGLAAEYADR